MTRYQTEIRAPGGGRRRQPFVLLRARDGMLECELPGSGVLTYVPEDGRVADALREDTPLIVTTRRIEE
jgi:hypothetical protein